MCTEEDATFIDNTPSFHLADGNVNDGYYLNDRIHLTHKATDKLALNLKLNIKKGCKSVCDSQPNRRPKEAPKEQSITQVNQTMTDNDVDLSHSFWSRAARKVTPKQRHTYPTNRRSRQTQVNKDAWTRETHQMEMTSTPVTDASTVMKPTTRRRHVDTKDP